MTTIIFSHGLVGGAVERRGTGIGYVRSYDPEAHDGQGDVTFTDDIARAHRFADAAEAFHFIMAVPACRPLRPDGKPNKPLTAFTLEVMPAPDPAACRACGGIGGHYDTCVIGIAEWNRRIAPDPGGSDAS